MSVEATVKDLHDRVLRDRTPVPAMVEAGIDAPEALAAMRDWTLQAKRALRRGDDPVEVIETFSLRALTAGVYLERSRQ